MAIIFTDHALGRYMERIPQEISIEQVACDIENWKKVYISKEWDHFFVVWAIAKYIVWNDWFVVSILDQKMKVRVGKHIKNWLPISKHTWKLIQKERFNFIQVAPRSKDIQYKKPRCDDQMEKKLSEEFYSFKEKNVYTKRKDN